MRKIMARAERLTDMRNLRPGLLLGALMLQACGGNYQAPLEDQSAVLERTPPPIYSTTGVSTATGAISSSSASGTSSAPAPSGARTIAAGVEVQPAPGVSVNVVDEPTGIRRNSLGRAPLDGSPAPVSAPAPAPAAVQGASAAPAVSAPAPSSQGAAGAQRHTVVRGDTLYSIAWQYSVDVRALALANNLNPPYIIYPGQELTVNISGVSSNAVAAVPTLPAAPAGDAAPAPVARAVDPAPERRTGNVPSKVVDDIAWQWPVQGRVLRSFSASSSATSRGIDIGASQGDAVFAAADGDVVYSGRGIQGQGDLIIIRHSARHLSAYSHNSAMLVQEGARVRAGDKIAEVGRDSRGAELLHFEVRVDGAALDPARYLP
jgi:lipoprotein NlpD